MLEEDHDDQTGFSRGVAAAAALLDDSTAVACRCASAASR